MWEIQVIQKKLLKNPGTVVTVGGRVGKSLYATRFENVRIFECGKKDPARLPHQIFLPV